MGLYVIVVGGYDPEAYPHNVDLVFAVGTSTPSWKRPKSLIGKEQKIKALFSWTKPNYLES